MIDIVYDTLIEKMKHSDIAKKHRITTRLIWDLSKSIRSNQSFFQELRDKQERKENINQLI